MDCSECGGSVLLIVSLPTELREYLPGDPETVTVCRRCLTVAPIEAEPVDDSRDVAALSPAVPDESEVALATALLVTLCESLALNRTEIEELVTRIERAGVDPLSTLDYLANDSELDLVLDVERRRPQLVQFLE